MCAQQSPEGCSEVETMAQVYIQHLALTLKSDGTVFFFHLFIVKTSLAIRQPSVHLESLQVEIFLDACTGINIKVSKQSDSSDLFPFHPSNSVNG